MGMNSDLPKLDFTLFSSIEQTDETNAARESVYPLSPFKHLTDGILAAILPITGEIPWVSCILAV